MESIDIKDISGPLLLTTSIGEGSKRKFLLMKEDYIGFKFSLEDPVHFKLGDYVDDARFGLFEVCDLQKPAYNTSTGGYDYDLRLDAYYWKWKNKIFKYTPEAAGREASWNLTAPLDVQAGIVLRNLKALGYTYKGQDFEFSIDSSVEDKSLPMSYDNINILDACFEMAKKWDCECWVTENFIHFGRLEHGDPVDFEIGVNVEDMTRSDSQSAYATRIYAFGSTRNIPAGYRPADESVVVNGVVQRRLMLPAGTPYIDAYPNMRTEEAVEQVVIFDDIYPRRVGTMSGVTTHEYTDRIEEEGKDTVYRKWNAYRFKDTGITFSEEYRLPGEELKITFQSGKLNGMTFAVAFNPCDKEGGETPIPEKLEDGSWNPAAQVWEIIRNEDYGRELPGDTYVPSNGDTYVLSGWDASKIMELGLVAAAELELKEKAEAHRDKAKVDPSTYTNRMMCDESGILLDAGARVNLVNPAFFESGSRQSRVIGFEYNLDIPYDHPVYTVGETASYSRIAELESRIESVTLKGQTYTGGGGSGVYLITSNDTTPATDRNTYSAKRILKELKNFLHKDRTDSTDYLLRLLGGLEVGEAVDSLIAGKGIIADSNGRIQADRMELRSSLTVLELLFNRLSAMEGDYSFAESGTIESVELLADGTYNLPLKKRWDNDFTGLKENDIIYGIVNNLASGSGEYHASWLRVLHVDTAANTVNAVLYPDSEVPGGRNHPPEPLTVITRRGNPADAERQAYWYLSGHEHCICMLDGVTKPILEESNYSVIVGRLKHLSLFDNLPINYRQSYVYCRGIAVQDILRIDYRGNPIRTENNRGRWSADDAAVNPYQSTGEVYDAVYHYGCKWMCLIAGTTDEPKYGSAGWAMIGGNPDFTVDIESSKGWHFDAEKFATTLTVTGELYNRDVTAHILDADVEWTRDTGNVTEDNAWAVAHAEAGKSLPLTVNDLGPDYMNLTGCRFIARVLLRDGQNDYETMNHITF